ncbi:leukocyte receptor cluster member 1 [Bubalus kerabau]|uniref:leukocyte receptor cluster member 1 n=1 Tax=Bubalus bubalis TaxID=89462 RepID=UPI00042CB623|nr:leukocyte receptor cluster member 1 [Bubalus bubalis]XP_055407629.1 leukocyte receptor cluster member 1 [Bubalus carabanensis]
MNILPKKSWHVRNKDNVARVRRDEAQAREEEKERERRVLLAQQEARTEFLRKKARHQNSLPAVEAAEAGAPGSSGPVDLFRELLEEGKAVTRGNKEYEEEKRQERERQEKALGILTYLGQSAAEAQTQPPWYQLPPRQGGPASGPGPDERIKSRLDPLREMQKHLGKKRKHSGDSGGHSTKEKKAPEKQRPKGPPSLEQLRADRLRREAAERVRAEALLARVGGMAAPEEQPEEVDERRRRYNSQFNPQLARRPRRQDPPVAP